MEKKLRYKLHKVKKQWVTIAVATIGLLSIIGMGSVGDSHVSADEATASEQVAAADDGSQETEAVASDSASSDDANTEVPAESSVPAEESTEVPAAGSARSSEETTETPVDQETAPRQEAANQAAGQEQAPASDGVRVERRDVAAVETAPAQAADLTNQEKEAAMSLDNVKQIDGNYYYVQPDGSYKKNFAITVNGQMLYFDADTGALSSTSTYSFSQGLTNLVDDFTAHNKAYNSNAESFELVDGYLTANSWYRPESILRNGQTWEASTADDLRPVLMSWWPDKDTQVAYLNYMSDYLGSDNENFTTETSQVALNKAAQLIQTKIEQRITAENNTEWLRSAIKAFVTQQSKWNVDSENLNRNDHLQHGALLYNNSDLTPWANSDYRLLNRTPTTQTGQQRYFADSNPIGGYEFLLSNDVDNSNPVVQAEMLNQLHYLMNWGSIVMGDDQANFDGVRVDAVDNVNADLLQVYTNYFQEYYGVNKSEADALAHISILEAWSYNDNQYNIDTNGAAISIDNYSRLAALSTLTRQLDQRQGLESLITDTLNKERRNDSAYGDTIANYSFVRAHDSEVQTIIAKIIAKEIDTTTDGYTFTLDQLKEAFKIYNEDMNKVEKTYTHYNIPAAYALLLSNMESVPRVYYGDLYTDDGQYMATKSPYFDAIDTLMRARIAYVSGGQAMNVAKTDSGQEVLTSVRFGQDIMTADDSQGTDLSRTSGMVTLVSNNPNLSLAANDTVTVNVGQVHANQAYRPLLLGTQDGVKSYLTDADTNLVKYTDENGNLTFTADDIKGYSTVDMSGYLAVWVPVGAQANQDIRVAASEEAKSSDDLTYKTSAALDSQLIYEGFSNFQDFATNDSEYTNKRIAENADLFKAWGVTSFEMAPQYVSTDDGTFIDSIIKNGYAFDDRYDLAMSQNNKYGSKEDLANALKALHAAGIQAIADWVPDQVYSLPGEEIVTATRIDSYGKEVVDAEIDHSLYAANTKSSGKDYQAQYGGEFLDELKAKYPSMFEVPMISNGQKLDTSTKIKTWEAKYFNGTNILKKGAGYVLSDDATGKYFTVNDKGDFLPAALTGDTSAQTGFYFDGKGMTYRSTSGNKAVSSFVYEGGHYYYFDKDGYMVTGSYKADNGKTYFFLSNGVQLRDTIYQDEKGDRHYYGKTGMLFTGPNWYSSVDPADPNNLVYRYIDANNVMATGLKTIEGATYYFDQDGYQAKGKMITDEDGNIRYFAENSGNMIKNDFAKVDNNWYYFDEHGIAAKGEVTINGVVLHFDETTGAQTKGFLTDANGRQRYYDLNSGAKLVKDFFSIGDDWYYADDNGYVAKGFRNMDGNWYYFDEATGKQAKGQLAVNGQTLYFHPDSGIQVKGDFVTDQDGQIAYYDANSGDRKTAEFFTTGDNAWYYADADGHVVKGAQSINGQRLYFDEATGKQAKGISVVAADGSRRHYDADSGSLVTNAFAESAANSNQWYYYDANGVAVKGEQKINNQELYFDPTTGQQAKGIMVTINGRRYYYDAVSGERVKNRYVRVDGRWYYFGADGAAV
ncbi:glycoside hydrolase family 70 protein [Streptococcus dentasini]